MPVQRDPFEMFLHPQATHTHSMPAIFIYPQIHVLFLPSCVPYYRLADPCRPISAGNWFLACSHQQEGQSEDQRVGEGEKSGIFSLTLSLLQGSNSVSTAPAPVESPYPLAPARAPQLPCSPNTPDSCCSLAKG